MRLHDPVPTVSRGGGLRGAGPWKWELKVTLYDPVHTLGRGG
jgi:hypothetical protein